MISSSKPPSGLRKALALPVLLAVMALACSKEQDAPAKDPMIKPLSVDNLRLAKITRDSVQVAMGTGLTKVFVIGNANKNGQVFHITFDTLGSRAKLDLQEADPIMIEGKADDQKVPPPPPPKVERP